MKAMILKNPNLIEENPLELVDIPAPEPKSHEILIQIKVCGICHTDLHTVEGELSLKKKPIIPGHQVVGAVKQIGKDVKRFRSGDLVGVAWLHSTCGNCPFCQEGNENLCEKAQFTGLDVDGGYAQYMVIPDDFAYPIPDGFSAQEAAPLLCAGIIGYRALRLVRLNQASGLASMVLEPQPTSPSRLHSIGVARSMSSLEAKNIRNLPGSLEQTGSGMPKMIRLKGFTVPSSLHLLVNWFLMP